MRTKTIEIVVHPSGELHIDAFGLSGTDCEKATAFLEEALGVIGQKQCKPEYHRRIVRKQVQNASV